MAADRVLVPLFLMVSAMFCQIERVSSLFARSACMSAKITAGSILSRAATLIAVLSSKVEPWRRYLVVVDWETSKSSATL